MGAFQHLNELRQHGRIDWSSTERGWIATPDEVVAALASEGFEEYKREVARSRSDREPTGGVWQGLNTATGSVASAVWVQRFDPPGAIVYIDIDGERLTA